MFDEIRKAEKSRKLKEQRKKLKEGYEKLSDEELDEEININEERKETLKEKIRVINRDISIAWSVKKKK